MKYTNSWHNPRNIGSRAYFETDVIPTLYKGYLIYHRINSVSSIESGGAHIFDVVKDGVCISQYAGINGAHKYIDTL